MSFFIYLCSVNLKMLSDEKDKKKYGQRSERSRSGSEKIKNSAFLGEETQ
jgi:hypothetical protein